MVKEETQSSLMFAICSLSTVLLASSGRSIEPQVFSTPRGEAQNVRFELAGNAIVHIDYDLVSTDPRAVFAVTLEASEDSGTTFTMRPQNISGDVGTKVRPGTGKRIIWDSGKDVERLQIDQFRFRIVATAGPLESRSSSGASTTRGGMSIKSNPPGAQVAIDGVARGVTPLDVHDLSPGTHRVTLTQVGFLENSRTFNVEPGRVEVVVVTLTAGTTQVAPTKTGQRRSSRAKWLIPLVAGGGLAAALGSRGGQPANATPATTPTSAGTGPAPSPPLCSFVVTPPSIVLTATDDRGNIAVSTAAGCSWTATSNVGFIRVNGSTFVGSDTVAFSIDPNTSGMDRSGALTVAERVVGVTQVASGPDTVAFHSLSPPNGSILVAGSASNNASAVFATVRYSLRSRARAFICVHPYFSTLSGPMGSCGPVEVSRGSGTVTVRLSVLESEPRLPVTTTLLRVFVGETPTFGSTTFLSGFEPATFTWTRP